MLGAMSAAPRPWARRAAMSIPGPVATAQNAEAATKTATPATNSRRRPRRSPSRPPVMRNTAVVNP